MSEKLRSVNTRFWEDPFIEDLSPSEKLLFLYLLTNPLANLLGIYEITVKRIAYDTGLSRETVQNGLKRFEMARKAFYCDNFIILPNWLKNQNLNKNMKIAVSREFNNLPNDLKNSIIGNHSEGLPNGSEGFRMIMERLGKYEIEIESKKEDEIETESDDPILSNLKLLFEVFRKSYPGSTRGLDTEFENLKKKHKDWRVIVPLLSEKLRYQISAREEKKQAGGFIPEWKNLQTWINQRCWEEEIPIQTNENQIISGESFIDRERRLAMQTKSRMEATNGN